MCALGVKSDNISFTHTNRAVGVQTQTEVLLNYPDIHRDRRKTETLIYSTFYSGERNQDEKKETGAEGERQNAKKNE